MKFCRIIFCLWLLVCFFPIGIHADIQLPSILSDNMVLQQNAKVRFWGKARPGEKILVKTSWDHKKYKVTALANGHWELMIQTPAATSGQSVMLKGDNKIRINNILIGEVWLCTGQSNMEFPVARNPQVKWKTGMLNEAEEMKDADFPEIRLFHVEHQLAPDDEKEDCVGKWVVCNPENLKDFSAVGFVFGRKLYKELSTPVGLIQSTWGGTHAESWTSMKVMENNPLYADVLKQYSKEKGIKFSKLSDIINIIQYDAQKYETVDAWMKHAMDNETAKECEGVNIITMHSAKGLEFEVVFIVDANQGLIPSARAIKQDEVEEERRLFYVAMTRTKKKLHIFGMRQNLGNTMQMSQFVGEALQF